MQSLDTLIKINKQALDEKRVELSQLETQMSQLEGWSNSMNSDLKKEQEFAAANPDMAMTFSAYQNKISEHQRNIRETMANLEEQINVMSDEITALFAEVKKYEILHQKRLLATVKEQKAKETKMLDEIAMNNYLKDEG